MKTILVALLTLLAGLAGCTDAPDSESTGTNADAPDSFVAQIDKPVWAVGDWWTYTTSWAAVGEFTLAVTGESGNNWVMDTDNKDMAFFHDALGEMSYLGDISKAKLSGSQETGAVNWLDFPLQDGKTWKATWDGTDFDMISHVDGQVAHVVASIGELPINNLVYDGNIGWFKSVSWGNLETGVEYGRMDLQESGNNFAGEVIRVDAEIIREGIQDGIEQQTFEVFQDGTMVTDDGDAYLQLAATCEAGGFQFGVGTFESLVDSNAGTGLYAEQGIIIDSQCPSEVQFAGVISETPGENTDHWGLLIGSESQDLHLEYTLYLRHFERITL